MSGGPATEQDAIDALNNAADGGAPVEGLAAGYAACAIEHNAYLMAMLQFVLEHEATYYESRLLNPPKYMSRVAKSRKRATLKAVVEEYQSRARFAIECLLILCDEGNETPTSEALRERIRNMQRVVSELREEDA